MAVEQLISEEAYQRFVLSGVEGSWEWTTAGWWKSQR